jgi:hypothetical protein
LEEGDIRTLGAQVGQHLICHFSASDSNRKYPIPLSRRCDGH